MRNSTSRSSVIDLIAPSSATVLPFPRTRRIGQIRKTATYIATAPSRNVGEAHLSEQLRKLRRRLEAIGVAPELVDREVEAYRAALVVETWRAVMLRDDGGAA